jgi:3-phenylpropionate/cinnamic acid dioxygenase small subunit
MPVPTLSLQDISDRIQIQDLLTRYALAIDTKDWALLDTCFVDDAEVDYTATGGRKGRYPEVKRWLEKALSLFAVTMHCIGNASVELDGDSARARTYLWNPMGFQKDDGELHWFTVVGHYVDELVRTGEGWRIQKRAQERSVIIGALPGSQHQ